MELKTIEQINHELDIVDAKLGILNLYYQDAANQRLHYEELCKSLRGSINQNRNDYNELEQEKKRLCGTRQTGLNLNKENSSPKQSNVASIAEGVFEVFDVITNVGQLKTLND